MSLWTNINAVLKEIGHYFYKTVEGLFQQASHIPNVVYAMITHDSTSTVTKHVGQIFIRDVLPIGAIRYAWHLAEPIGRDYFFDDESGYATQATGLFVMGGLVTAKIIFMTRNTIRYSIHSAVLTLESTKGLNELNKNTFTVCTDGHEVCSGKRYAQGAVRDTVTFYMTEALLSGLGGSMARVLSVYHYGDYITKMLLLNVCDRHQVEYLKEHSELALSIGLAHAFTTASMTFMAQKYTGIPPIYYQNFFSQIVLLWLVSTGARMSLPAAVKKSERIVVDPVLFLQSAMGFATDTFLLGLKSQIPRMMGQSPSDIPWATIMNYLEVQWSRPWAERVKYIVLPSMLHSRKQFLSDPVIDVYFEERRKIILAGLNRLWEIKRQFVVSKGLDVANSSDFVGSLVAFFAKKYAGTPPAITRLLIKIISNDRCMRKLKDIENYLERFDVTENVEYSDNNYGQLRCDQPTTELNESLPAQIALSDAQIDQILSQAPLSPIVEDPSNIIQPTSLLDGLDPENIIGGYSNNTIKDKEDAFDIIKGVGTSSSTLFNRKNHQENSLTSSSSSQYAVNATNKGLF